MPDQPSTPHYRAPGRLTRGVLNPLVMAANRLGLSLMGSRTLEVPGRASGEMRRTPVNLLVVDDASYLVSPRGETQWVRNVRANGGRLALVVGRRRSEIVAVELADGDKPAVIRQYLRRWKAEVGVFFDGVGPDSSDEELATIAPRHPVFRLGAAPR